MSAARSDPVTAGKGANLDEAEVLRFFDEARECAMQVLKNAAYILTVLDNVQMCDDPSVAGRDTSDAAGTHANAGFPLSG